VSAQELRDAAALMRKRARAACSWDGNWRIHPERPGRVIEVKGDGWDDAIVASCIDYGGTENGTEKAAHIQSWRPAVALGVADLLDLLSEMVDDYPNDLEPAVDLARAYLGSAS
jgi:hypothetical protein